MADELEQLRVRLAARLRELNIAPDDPRIVPLFAQAQSFIRERVAAGGSLSPLGAVARVAFGLEDGRPSAAALEELPARLREVAQTYIQEQSRLPWYGRAPALSASDA